MATEVDVQPIEWPTATAGGMKLTVKPTFQSRYLLSKWKLSWRDASVTIFNGMRNGLIWRKAQLEAIEKGEPFNEPMPATDPEELSYAIQLFAASVGHHYIALGQVPPTPDYWAGVIRDEEWDGIMTALVVAMGKVLQESQKKTLPTTPLAPSQPEAIQ